MKDDVEESYGKGAFSKYIGKDIIRILGLLDMSSGRMVRRIS